MVHRLSDWPALSPKLAALREQSDRQVLLRGLVIEGRVIDEQERPIAGARIDDSTRALGSAQFAWCHQASAEGRFQLHLPRENNIVLTAEAEGYAPATQAASPGADQPAITFQLAHELAAPRGRVIDPAGHPIEGARVLAFMVPRIKPIAFHAWTDEHGQFEWGDAPAQTMNFQITAEGYIDAERHQLTAGDAVAEVTLRPAVDVQIVAVDAQTREAIARFRAQIGTHDARTNGFLWGPQRGRSAPRRFEILLWQPKRAHINLKSSAEGYLPARILVPKERTVLRKTIPLQKAPK